MRERAVSRRALQGDQPRAENEDDNSGHEPWRLGGRGRWGIEANRGSGRGRRGTRVMSSLAEG